MGILFEPTTASYERRCSPAEPALWPSHGTGACIRRARQQQQKALFVGCSELHHRCAVPIASRDRRRTSEDTGSYIQPPRARNTK
eukprot:1458603-Prymnesium_polylepis.1